jgi:glucose-6-phosphate isomerase
MSDVLRALHGLSDGIWFDLGAYRELFDLAMARLDQLGAGRRIWGRDGSLWSEDLAVAAAIEDRLGWLDLPSSMPVDVARLYALAAEVQAAGLERPVLLGMGGSSLAAEVMQCILGKAVDHCDLAVLDSTDPTQIRRVAGQAALERTLFIAASKTGTTLETLSLLSYFQEQLQERVGWAWPQHFIAITDPGTRLYSLASEQGFRAVYGNPPGIGGRYSALSLYGLVPAALLGVDLDRLLSTAKEMAWRCRASGAVAASPGMVLGAIMGALLGAEPPRDKLTLLASDELLPFGPWIEQLVAESTGKDGKGILPVEREPRQRAEAYGPDRLFCYLRLAGADNRLLDEHVRDLVAEGRPVVAVGLRDPYDLGAAFFLWEYATAVSGVVIGVNPFDQPNVELAKARASAVLGLYGDDASSPGAPPQGEPAWLSDGLAMYGPPLDAQTAGEYLAAYLRGARPGDYVSIMAYIERNAETEHRLQLLRALAGRIAAAATTVGYGPRFLHSTGQLHKGGPDTGVFIQITQDEAADLPIPGQPYTFGILKGAQAAGDLMALQEMRRRVVRIHTGPDVLHALDVLISSAQAALGV